VTGLSQEEQDQLWQDAEAEKKAAKPVRRNLVGGPLDGKQVVIPETQLVNDVGWWTQHYVLQPAGFMLWSRKE
jgi:hypothetical protein